MFEIKEYICWRIKAHGRAGIHSPFLYRLSDIVFPSRFKNPHIERIEQLRNRLKHSSDTINVQDLGAGSKKGKSNFRKISDIVKNASKSKYWATVLYALAADRKPHQIIELGTSLGISGLYLASAIPDGTLYTLEGCPNTAQIAKNNFNELQFSHVDIRVGHFNETLPRLLDELNLVELVYIDGNHTEEATLHYFQMLKKKAGEKTLFIFDDIHWSEGMQRAWKEICKDSDTSLTVDLFQLGLVFFDKNLSKQHFNIVL